MMNQMAFRCGIEAVMADPLEDRYTRVIPAGVDSKTLPWRL